LILLNNFHPSASSPYFPMEELSESEADFLVFCYKDISSDDADFSTGLAPLLLPNGQETDETCGKIGIWAWAAMRVLDYGLTLPGTDPNNIAIAGHSRLGKTALFTAMLDTRFRFVFSNAAGCTGDSLAHGNSGLKRTVRTPMLGELICDITENFPYWFCKKYKKYAKKNISDTFDQHFLLALSVPRHLLVGSAAEDTWADPHSEFYSLAVVNEAYNLYGMTGLVYDEVPKAKTVLSDGDSHYHLRFGSHYFGREDWNDYIDFIIKKMNI
jgi:hypothetical protein